MLVIEGLNFGLIGQEPLKLDHKFGTTWTVTDNGQVFTATINSCTSGENGCRHIEAVNRQYTDRNRKRPEPLVIPWYRVKGKALRAIAKEAQESHLYKNAKEYFNGVYLDPEIEF